MTMLETSSSFGFDESCVSESVSLTELLRAMKYALELNYAPGHSRLPRHLLRRCLAVQPLRHSPMSADSIDRVCEIFAEVIDAKSVFMRGHSLGVAKMAMTIGEAMKLKPERLQVLRRSALLHDIGKLRVPNTVLDKVDRLTGEDWTFLLDHSRMTRTILERVPAFREVAIVAGEHHERLDGSGYPQALCAKQMSLESRILIVADCFVAMCEDRPYRVKMSVETILGMLEQQVPAKLDAMCFEALLSVVERRLAKRPSRVKVPWRKSGLTPHWGWSHLEQNSTAGAM